MIFKILLIFSQLFFLCFSFERIIFKSFTEPSNTELKDFWEVFDTDKQLSLNDYLICNGEKFFGPF